MAIAVETQIKKACDRFAAGRIASKAAFGDKTNSTDFDKRFWKLIDDTDDETYENTVSSAEITKMDAALFDGVVSYASIVNNWFTAHNSYFTGLSGLTITSNLISAYIKSKGWRVSQDFADVATNVAGLIIDKEYVMPKGIAVASGNNPSFSYFHKFGTLANSAMTTVDGVLPVTSIGSIVSLISETATTTVTSLVITCTLQDRSTTKDFNITLPDSNQYTQVKVGAQALTGGAVAGQKVIPVAATAQFTAGEWVVIIHNDSTQEVAQVDSITANTSLTLKTNLIQSYVTSDLVIPLFTNVAYKSGSVASTKTIGVYAMPERTVAL